MSLKIQNCLMVSVLVIGGTLLTSVSRAAMIDVITVDFCPYICETGPRRGVVVDIATAALEQSGHTLRLRFAPWERVVQTTREGGALAALSPAKSEAPDFIFPTENVGTQRFCFFATAGNSWRYTGPQSLKDQRIGVVAGASMAELNDWLTDPANAKNIDYIQSSDPASANFRKLSAGRLTVVLEDEAVGRDNLTRSGLKADVVGCLSGEPIYLGLTPAPSRAAQSKAIAAAFDAGIAKLRESGALAKILAEYNLKDWK